MRSRAGFALCFALVLPAAASAAEDLHHRVDPWVLETAARGDAEFLVMLREQSDLRGARALSTKVEKSAFVADALAATAARTQGPLLALLSERGVPHRAYWVANMIWVRGGLALVEELAARGDVFHIYANPSVRMAGPVDSSSGSEAPDTIEWSVAQVHAPEVWALGYKGAGVVVAGADTGYQWDHPALKLKYRGWNGAANHNYNWHDAIHDAGSGNPCGSDSPFPCDDFGHGTHTMGTMVGDDGGANKIGVAPSAKWIGCRNMDDGAGTPARLHRVLPVVHRPDRSLRPEPRPHQGPGRDQQLVGLHDRRGLHRSHDPSGGRRERARRGHRSRRVRGQLRFLLRHGDRPPRDLRRLVLGGRDGLLRRHRRLLEPRPRDRGRQQPAETRHLGSGRGRALLRAGQRLRATSAAPAWRDPTSWASSP